MQNPEAYLARLKPIYIFKGLTDQQILQVAAELEVEHYPAGAVVFEQGSDGRDFFIINRGQVKVLRQLRGQEPRQIATLVEGDFFGEGGLLYGRRRSATIEAITDLEVFGLSHEAFKDLLKDLPILQPNLALAHASHELTHQHPLPWLSEGEVVYLLTRRHHFVLLQKTLLPLVLAMVTATASLWLAAINNEVWMLWAGTLAMLPFLAWLLWAYIDWTNDYFIVTNRRVVHLEKIIAIYDSRQEAPLDTIISVDMETDDVIQRLLRMGDVTVRAISGSIHMTSVPNPGELAAAVEQFWQRAKQHERHTELDKIRDVIRNRLEHGLEKPPPSLLKPSRPPPPTVAEVRPFFERLVDFFSFRMRFQKGDTVIYRKHWFILGMHLWKPSLAILLWLAINTVLAAGLVALPASLPILLAASGLTLLAASAWWLYEYIDWRNDIYMVTKEQIFDIRKKPLSTETKKVAPLDRVETLRYERPGFLGVMLNFGTVIAETPGADFLFEGVFDPVSVQHDVYRRLEEIKHRNRARQAAQRREELADWVGAYHEVQRQLAQPPPPEQGA
jgi:hypothetical protein